MGSPGGVATLLDPPKNLRLGDRLAFCVLRKPIIPLKRHGARTTSNSCIASDGLAMWWVIEPSKGVNMYTRTLRQVTFGAFFISTLLMSGVAYASCLTQGSPTFNIPKGFGMDVYRISDGGNCRMGYARSIREAPPGRDKRTAGRSSRSSGPKIPGKIALSDRKMTSSTKSTALNQRQLCDTPQ